jgi:hypothetical protein
MLSAEVSMNMQLLGLAEQIASPIKVPPDFETPTIVFDAVAERIGELPSQAVREVIFLYRYFSQLNQLPAKYVGLVDELRALAPDSPHRPAVERELQSCVSVFNSYVANAIHRCNLTQPLLLKSALPWWSPRRYQQEPSRLLETGEMAERARVAQEARARLADELRKRDR